jgi:short-subunit dehydrogenase
MPNNNAKLRNSLIMMGAAGVAAWGLMRAGSSRLDFSGQTVLITGGSRGLGLALAEEFRSHGADLVLLARNQHELDLAKDQLEHNIPDGGRIRTFVCDVSSHEEVLAAIDRATMDFGAIDVVANVAGVIQVGPVESQTLADFQEAMNINFWGVVHTTLAVLPQMMDRRRGRIVNITSIGGKIAVPHLLPYTCSKFAAVGFSLGLRAEVAQKGISVTTVVPGLMRTGSYMNAEFKGDRQKEYSWFSVSSSVPGLTISAENAARQIVQATANGTAEIVLGAPHKFASEFAGIFPGLTADILSAVNFGLPDSSKTEKRLGRESRTRVSESFITKLGRQAADRYNQHAKVS